MSSDSMKPTDTPNRLARELVTAWDVYMFEKYNKRFSVPDEHELQKRILNALTQYGNACAEAEREWAAKQAEVFSTRGIPDTQIKHRIAELIRARTVAPSGTSGNQGDEG